MRFCAAGSLQSRPASVPKFVPLCKQVAEAGWEPLTGAVSDNDAVIAEQFRRPPAPCYLTLYNLAESSQRAAVKLTTLSAQGGCSELISGQGVKWNQGAAEFELPPGEVRVLKFN